MNTKVNTNEMLSMTNKLKQNVALFNEFKAPVKIQVYLRVFCVSVRNKILFKMLQQGQSQM